MEEVRYTLVWGRGWKEGLNGGVRLGGDRVLIILESRILGNNYQGLWTQVKISSSI